MPTIGRTSNPALSDRSFEGLSSLDRTGSMTIQGTVNKTVVLLALVAAGALHTWRLSMSGASIAPWMLLGGLGGLVFALITIFKRTWAPATAPVYALLEGLAIGGVSALFERRFPGIVMQAVALTFTTLFALLAAYKSRAVRVTDNFRLMVAAATGGIFLLYLVNFLLTMFTPIRMPYLHESGPGGILVSLFIVFVASLNLVLDFDFIERGADHGAPKFMEWYGAFGLIMTLIWLYFEMLRLLSKLKRR